MDQTKFNHNQINLPRHQQLLKQKLLHMHHKQASLPAGEQKLFNMNFKSLLGYSMAIALAIALGFGLLNSNQVPVSQARQLVTDAKFTTEALDGETFTKVTHRLGVDPKLVLEEALQAPDLEYLGSNPDSDGMIVVTKAPSDPNAPATEHEELDMSYIRYTNSDGHRVTLGIDDQNIPVFIFTQAKFE